MEKFGYLNLINKTTIRGKKDNTSLIHVIMLLIKKKEKRLLAAAISSSIVEFIIYFYDKVLPGLTKKKEKKCTQFEMNSNKTVNNVLDK